MAELESLDEPGPPWAHANEFQTKPDPDMFGRLLVYLGTYWLSARPDPLPGSRYNLGAAVVNLTGTQASQPSSRSMVLPAPKGGKLVFEVLERWLQDEPAAPLLEAIRSGRYSRWLLVLIPLHQADDPADVIRQWLELFHAELDAGLRSEWHGLTVVLSELSRHKDLWRIALEGLTVTRSPFLESIRAEGHKEGIKEGRAEDRSEALIQLLRAKFSQQVAADIIRRVEQSRDLDQLRAWFTAALDAATWDDFLQRTSLSTNGQ